MYEIETKIKEGGIYYTDTETCLNKTQIQSIGGIDNRPVLVLRNKLPFDHDNVLIAPGTTSSMARTSNVKYATNVYRFKLHELKTIAASYLKSELCCLPTNILEMFKCISEAYTLCRTSNAAYIVSELKRFKILMPEYDDDIKNAISYVMKNFSHTPGILKTKNHSENDDNQIIKIPRVDKSPTELIIPKTIVVPESKNIETENKKDIVDTNKNSTNVPIDNEVTNNANPTMGFSMEEWAAFAKHFKCTLLLNIAFNVNLDDYSNLVNYNKDILNAFTEEKAFITKCHKSQAYKLNMGKYAPYQLVLAKVISETCKRIVGKCTKSKVVGSSICSVINNSSLDTSLNAALFIVSQQTSINTKLVLLKLLYDDSEYMSKFSEYVAQETSSKSNIIKREDKLNTESVKLDNTDNAINLFSIDELVWRKYINTNKLSKSSIKIFYPGTYSVTILSGLSDDIINKLISYVPDDFMNELHKTYIGKKMGIEYVRKISPLAYILYNKLGWYKVTSTDKKYLNTFDNDMVKYMTTHNRLLEVITITISNRDITSSIGIYPSGRVRFCEALGYKLTKKRIDNHPTFRSLDAIDIHDESAENDRSLDEILPYGASKREIIGYLYENSVTDRLKVFGIYDDIPSSDKIEVEGDINTILLERIPMSFINKFNSSILVEFIKVYNEKYLPILYAADLNKRMLVETEKIKDGCSPAGEKFILRLKRESNAAINFNLRLIAAMPQKMIDESPFKIKDINRILAAFGYKSII